MNTETRKHRETLDERVERLRGKRPRPEGLTSWLYLGLILFFLPTILSAQSPFTGGQGDGYAKASLSHVQVSLDKLKMSNWKVYPQPVRQNEGLTIELPENQFPLRLYILNTKGQIVLEQKTFARTKTISVEMNQLLAGVYILQITSDQERFRQQIVVLNE